MGLRDRAAAWKRRARRLEREVHSVALAARDDRTPWYARAVVVLVVGYALSPIDPIPDVLPVVGYLDELVVLPAGVALAVRLIPDPALADARERTAEADPTRARLVVAGLTVLAWAVVAYLAVRAVGVPVP